MRTEKQRQASRTNGKKSRGPKTPEGIDVSKMNGLKHGLCSGQVVLPGEDPAEFAAELAGWAGEFPPGGHMRAVLVERAAVASWRLRRCVRAEKGLLLELAAERRDARQPAGAGAEVDDELGERLDDAEAALRTDPAAALAELRATPEGVDRLIGRWDEIAEAEQLEWDEDAHAALMPLLGHRADADAAAAGPLAEASHRLVLDRDCRYTGMGDDLLTDDEEREATARLRRGIVDERAALRALRRELAAARPEPDAGPAPEPGATFAGVTPALMLLHRYEMAHERSLRATLKDLAALEKARPAEVRESQVVVKKDVKENESASPVSPEPGESAAPSEPGPSAGLGASGGPRGDRTGLPRPRGRRRRRRTAR